MNSQAKLTQTLGDQRILVILFGTLEYDGRAQRLLEIMKGLGHVTVVDILNGGADQTTVVADVDRIQIRLPSLANRIMRHMLFGWGALRAAHRQKATIVVAENFFTTALGRILAWRCRAKLVYDAYELIIPDPTRLMTTRDRFWYLLEKWTIRRAKLVIAANEERANLMAIHYCLKKRPIIMHNMPVSAAVQVAKENPLERWPELCRRAPDEVLVLYQGDVSLLRGIDRFVRSLSYLGSEFRMVIVGGGSDLDHIRRIGHQYEMQGRLVILGRVDHRLLPSISVLADVGIVTYPSTGLNNIYCASNKIFQYAQAGLPVVSTDQPPLRRVVESYGIGRLVNKHDSPEQLALVIKEVARNRHKYSKALNRFLEDHRCENEAEIVKAAIDNITTGSGLT